MQIILSSRTVIRFFTICIACRGLIIGGGEFIAVHWSVVERRANPAGSIEKFPSLVIFRLNFFI